MALLGSALDVVAHGGKRPQMADIGWRGLTVHICHAIVSHVVRFSQLPEALAVPNVTSQHSKRRLLHVQEVPDGFAANVGLRTGRPPKYGSMRKCTRVIRPVQSTSKTLFYAAFRYPSLIRPRSRLLRPMHFVHFPVLKDIAPMAAAGSCCSSA